MARSDRRREPAFDDDRGDDLRAERRGARKNAHEGAEKSARARKNAQSRSGFLFGGLIYWTLVLSLWGAIGAGGVFVYYGSQLPPIHQLAIPKRPPNIAILADDGEPLATRGDTGGAAVRLSELPPYLPKAFIAIEDRRFYSHFAIDPLGIVRALTPTSWTRRRAGRLDADPAARQEPVFDAGTHDLPQASGGDAGALART